MTILAEIDKKYPGRVMATAGPLANWKMYREMKEAVRTNSAIPGRGRLVGCGCIFNRLSVRADGAYVPCVTLPQMVLGYVGRDSLQEIWTTSPQLDVLRSRVNINLESFRECKDCVYIKSCTGNCAGNAFSLLGEVNRPSPQECLRNFDRDLDNAGISGW
jgi:radical SAM protein with 4Fe4S-binding SPASM domain